MICLALLLGVAVLRITSTYHVFNATIDEASHIIPLERLALSPQCGFASTMEGNRISFEDQRRKLELVASVAREVWGSQG